MELFSIPYSTYVDPAPRTELQIPPMLEHAVILVAEDREDDRLLIRRAFSKAGVVNPMHFVHDGEEAVAYLKGEGKYSRRDEFPIPTLLLLDLKMPKWDGFDV